MSNRYPLYFTRAEIVQLRAYAENRDEGDDAGWYYGNKRTFETRHAQILLEIDAALREARKPTTTDKSGSRNG